MNADGTNFVQLTDNAVFDGGPNFSPDGKKILFIRSLGPGQGQELFVMNADGTNEMQLTNTQGFNTLARWGVTLSRSDVAGGISHGDLRLGPSSIRRVGSRLPYFRARP
jgi:hypothetical protein